MSTLGIVTRRSLWQQRIVGGLWALLGLAFAVQLLRLNPRNPSILLGLPYLVAGVAFLVGCGWARRAMLVLLVLAGLLFADWMLAGLMLGNGSLFLLALAGFGFTAYSAAFVLRSRLEHGR